MSALAGNLFHFLHSVFAFILILVPLVVFHEFGHYLFARIFGVKAEIFSVGFGPTLFGWKRGETEWRISAIPLGGYVKLLGEDRDAELSPEDKSRALHTQKPWKRFFIFFGGPLFNFILAAFIFMVILFIGEPQVASVVGRVVPGSAAEQVGFRSRDEIVSVDGVPVKKFEEVVNAMSEKPGKKIDFEVLHAGSTQRTILSAVPTSEPGFSAYGESTQVGVIDGLFASARSTVAGVSQPGSAAYQAGFRTLSKITKFNDVLLKDWEELEAFYQGLAPDQAFELSFKDPDGSNERTIKWKKPAKALQKDAQTGSVAAGLGPDFGLFSSELFVEKTVKGSPAEAAGLKTGDRLVAVGNQEVQSFMKLKELVQESGEKTGVVPLTWEREGKLFKHSIKPTASSTKDPILRTVTHFTIGVIPSLMLNQPATFIERVYNPFKLVYLGCERMVSFTYRNFISLKKMFTGDVSLGSLGGPIMIGKIAGESMARGIILFLSNMAIFSIGLGVLNILPVPVLDGGHLLLLGIEMIRGQPLTIRQMEVIQSVGLVLILALMATAFYNDFARLIYSG